MEQNTFAARIAQYRKEQSMTQEALASALGLTAQAVSKWENGQGYPDVSLLPKLADLFGVSIDALFGREAAEKPLTIPQSAPDGESKDNSSNAPIVDGALPWSDDRQTLHAVLYAGHVLIGYEDVTNCPEATRISFCYEGDALNVDSVFSVNCGDVAGSVSAGGGVNCDTVNGNATAGGDLNCDRVGGSAQAGGDLSCDGIGGNASAGCDISCDAIGGSAQAGCDINCDELNGSNVHITAGGDIQIDEVNGSVAGAVSSGESFNIDIDMDSILRQAKQTMENAMQDAFSGFSSKSSRAPKTPKTPKSRRTVTIRYRPDEAPDHAEAPKGTVSDFHAAAPEE